MKGSNEVVVLIGAGSIGQAIARRVSTGKHILISDIKIENAEQGAKTLSEAGFEVSTSIVDIASSMEKTLKLIKKLLICELGECFFTQFL